MFDWLFCSSSYIIFLQQAVFCLRSSKSIRPAFYHISLSLLSTFVSDSPKGKRGLYNIQGQGKRKPNWFDTSLSHTVYDKANIIEEKNTYGYLCNVLNYSSTWSCPLEQHFDDWVPMLFVSQASAQAHGCRDIMCQEIQQCNKMQRRRNIFKKKEKKKALCSVLFSFHLWN